LCSKFLRRFTHHSGTNVFEFQLGEGVFLNKLVSDYKAGMNRIGAGKGEAFSKRVMNFVSPHPPSLVSATLVAV
jgi:hypothetical protein